jgi:hypothetical protein
VARLLRIAAGMLGCYIALYAVLSLMGHRVWATKPPRVPAHYHDNQWMPLGCGSSKALRIVFWPLLVIDRAFIHPEECDCDV